MAVTKANLAMIIRDLNASDTNGRSEAQEKYDAVPLDMKMWMLLDLVHNMSGEEEFWAVVAGRLADLIAFNFLKYFGALTPSEQDAFLKSFIHCLDQWVTIECVREKLCAALADMSCKLLDRPEWGCSSFIESAIWKYVHHSLPSMQVTGWSVLARCPWLIDPERRLWKLFILLELDAYSENKQAVAQAAASCALTFMAEYSEENAWQIRLSPLLPSILTALERSLDGGDDALLRKLKACCGLSKGVLDSLNARVVAICFKYAAKPEAGEDIRTLCLELVSKLTAMDVDLLKEIAESVPHIIAKVLEASVETPGKTLLDSKLFQALERLSGEMRFRFNDYFCQHIPGFWPVRSMKSIGNHWAGVLITATAGGVYYDHRTVFALALIAIKFLRSSSKLHFHRIYNHIINLLHGHGRWASEGLSVRRGAPLDILQMSALEEEKDPIVRSLVYKRHEQYAESTITTVQTLREALPFWENILLMEIGLYVETGITRPLVAALKALTVIFKHCHAHEHMRSRELLKLFGLLRNICSLNEVGHPFTSKCDFLRAAKKAGMLLVDAGTTAPLIMAAVNCALAAVPRPKETAMVSHVAWIVSALQKLQPVEGPSGFNNSQLEIVHGVQSAWESLLLVFQKDEAVLAQIVPSAMECIMKKAAGHLVVEVVEDCPEVRAALEDGGARRYYLMGNGRYAGVQEKGLESKQKALQSTVWGFIDAISPRLTSGSVSATELGQQPLLSASSGIVDVMIADFKSRQHILRSLGCEGPSHHAARCLMGMFTTARKLDGRESRNEDEGESNGVDEGPEYSPRVLELCMTMTPHLMAIFCRPTAEWWCNCFLTILGKCLQHLPEQRVVALLPDLTSIISRALAPFHPSWESAWASESEDPDDDWKYLMGESSGSGAPRTIARVIAATVSKCSMPNEAGPLYDLLAFHCEQLCATASSRENLALGLEILSDWSSKAPIQVQLRMPWMFAHLVSLLKRLSMEARGERNRRPFRSSGCHGADSSGVFVDQQLLKDAARCLAQLAPFYQGQAETMGPVLTDLTIVHRCGREEEDADVIVSAGYGILQLVADVITNDTSGLSNEGLNEALREALTGVTGIVLLHAMLTCPAMFKALVQIFRGAYLPSSITRKYPAITANLSLACGVAGNAVDLRFMFDDDSVIDGLLELQCNAS